MYTLFCLSTHIIFQLSSYVCNSAGAGQNSVWLETNSIQIKNEEEKKIDGNNGKENIRENASILTYNITSFLQKTYITFTYQ